MLNFVCQVFLTKFLIFFCYNTLLIYYKQIDTRLNDVKSLHLFFFLLVSLHKFSRVRPSTIFSFAIILIWYLLAAMFVMLLLTRSLSDVCHNIKPLWFVIDYLSESCARTEGTLGKALGQVPKARSKGLEWLATKGELLAAKGVGYADRNTEVERSEILVLRHPLLCPFVLFSILRSPLYCGESARHTMRKCNF